jgi:predicted glycogen debranching enzyme
MSLYSIDTQGELHPFLNYEWLLANGIGGFASSSVVGCNTRRYHGLLCAATLPPVGRMMMLNRIGELVYLNGRKDQFTELSINQFGNSLHPRGERFLRKFQLGRSARWEFEVEGVRIIKELQILWKQNAIGLRYQIQPQGKQSVELHLLPFVSMRDFHALRRAAGLQFDVTCDLWQMSIAHGSNKLHLRTDSGRFERRGDWWYGQTYAIETERGQDDTEDLFVPGALIHECSGPSMITLWAGIDGPNLYDWDEELLRRPEAMGRKWVAGHRADNASDSPPTTTIRRLSRAAADFVVERKRPDGSPATSIIAGYPWFADWGRDTMISLPGLLLTTGRFAEAAEVLALFGQYVSEGMIPNRFDDYTSEPSYNTVDASLWFIHACFEYRRLSGDSARFESAMLPACRAIIEGYRKGTRFNIHMDGNDGLIVAGDEHTQLTWMDAKCDGIAFTPRHGKAVEINALWYNALRLVGEDKLADKVQQSFVKTFWLSPFRGLFDVVNGAHREGAIRPNQIFAASLPHSPLSQGQQSAVVEVVRRELLTPYGLRTLAKSEHGYQGRYLGPPMQRDRAYHNGTIWPWLIGPFLEAYLKVHGNSSDALRQARVWLQPLIDHMNQGCIGQIAEIFEADEPHRSVGCPAQAWSVAEVLRIAVMLEM